MIDPTLNPELVKHTQKWVAQTFYGTLLKQVREAVHRVVHDAPERAPV